MDEQKKQTILDVPKVIAVGIASPVATVLTSRFGIAGTLIGLALSAVILTALVDVLKVYLARVPGAVTTIPGGFRKRHPLRNILDRIRLPFSKFASLPPARRRSIIIGGIVAAGISFIVGLGAVTALEVGVGKSLSCWVWNNCSTESSTDEGETSTTGTLPSVFGGGQSVSSGALEAQPPSPPQPTPGAPGSPSRPEGVPGSERPASTPPDQRSSQFSVPEEGEQRSSSYGNSEEYEGPYEQPSPVDESEVDQRNQPSSGSNRKTWESPTHPAPWTT